MVLLFLQGLQILELLNPEYQAAMHSSIKETKDSKVNIQQEIIRKNRKSYLKTKYLVTLNLNFEFKNLIA